MSDPAVSLSPLSGAIRGDAGPAVRERPVAFAAADGFPLHGTLFEGDGDGPLVLISSATAVPRGFYAAFARAICAAGARAAFTYDYRGLPGSPRPKRWASRIGMKDWAVLDLPAAAAVLDAVTPQHAMVGVGQSYGGQALGLCGIAERFVRYGMVATMSGYHRGLDDRWAAPRMFVIGVPVASLFGKVPRWLGIGEPIPASVFRDWARWCRRPDYFFGDPAVPETARYAEVHTPILSIGLTDDRWGTRRAVQDMMRRYANAQVEVRWLSPGDGGAPIGHLGFFRSRFSQTLWPQFIGWLLQGTEMGMGEIGAAARACFSPFTGRRCRQADEGRSQGLQNLGPSQAAELQRASFAEVRAAPHPPFGHLLPVSSTSSERGEGKACPQITTKSSAASAAWSAIVANWLAPPAALALTS